MGRQPTLTVNVNAQQFQQFARQFTQFTQQINNLNRSFAQINSALNRSNVLMRSMRSTVNATVTGLKSVASWTARITKQFLGWSVIIGGVSALLGAGGSLYGIDRLASSIMAKRRQSLGLGQDYGRTQAANIFSQGLIGSPQGVMQNIRLGQMGSQDQMVALLGMGINPFGAGGKMSPDEIMDSIVEKLPDLLNRAGPGKQLMMAQAFKLDKLFTDPMDLLRLSTEEGRKEYEEKRKLVKEYEPLLKITPKAQKAWTELSLQFQAAKAQLESVFGEQLAVLAGPLKRLSDAFASLIRKLMESEAVRKIIKKLGEWIDALAEKLKGITEKDIEDFLKKWLPDEKTIENFKKNMEEFVEILKSAVQVLEWIKSWTKGFGFYPGPTTGAGPGRPTPPIPGGPGTVGTPGSPYHGPPRPTVPLVPPPPGVSGPQTPGALPTPPPAGTPGGGGARPTPVPPGAGPARAAPTPPPPGRPGGAPPTAPPPGSPGGGPSTPPSSAPAPAAPAPVPFTGLPGAGIPAIPSSPSPAPPSLPPSSIAPPPAPFSFGGNQPGAPGRGSPFGGGGAGTSPLLFPGGAPGGVPNLQSSMRGAQSSVTSALSNAQSVMNNFSPRGGTNNQFGTWKTATANMLPTPSGSPIGSEDEGLPQGARRKDMGGMNIDNWQMNRTANLVVRNVPGANIFMTATGMNG